MNVNTVQTFKIVAVLSLPLIAVLAMVMGLFFGQSGQSGPEQTKAASQGTATAMRLTVPTSAALGDNFTVSIFGDLTPDVPIGGFGVSILIDTDSAAETPDPGVSYNGSGGTAACLAEVKPRDAAGNNPAICDSFTPILTGGHAWTVLTVFSLPLEPLEIASSSKVALVNASYSCNTVGTHRLSLGLSLNGALGEDPDGAAYGAAADAAAILVKGEAQDVDVDGDTTADFTDVADTTTIECTEPPPSDPFTVSKVYSDDNTTPVTITLTCVSGDVSPETAPAAPGSPASFNVSGHTDDPECTATESGEPAGYNGSGDPPGTCQAALLAVGECTITNTVKEGSFTVFKEYNDDTTTPVTITLSCTSGEVSPEMAPAAPGSPGSPAVFNVTGYTDDPECTATESGVPAGYNGSGDPPGTCQAALVAVGSCTITNTLKKDSFIVDVNFSDENEATVSIDLSCTSGAPNQTPLDATHTTNAEFNVKAFTGDPTCTASQNDLPSGYNGDESGCAEVLLTVGECTIVNQLISGPFTVSKEYSDDNTAAVSVTVTCVGATVDGPFDVSGSGTPGVAGPPVTFTVTEFEGNPECTAIESGIPAGYTGDESFCAQVLLTVGECTIVNQLISGPFTVSKEYSDDNTTAVSVTVTCVGATVDGPFDVSGSGTPGVAGPPVTFTVTEFEGKPECTATESGIPVGYTGDESSCAEVLLTVGECTIVNQLISGPFTVSKEYSDDSTAAVSITVTCVGATVNGPFDVLGSGTAGVAGSPVTFTVTAFEGNPVCTATEPGVPVGYTGDESFCAQVLLTVGECTIVNDLNSGPFTVSKEYSDDNTAAVSITVTCVGATVDGPFDVSGSGTAGVAGPPVTFTVLGFEGDPVCTATELDVPAGYTESFCQVFLSVGECTIVNDLNSGSFTVSKEYSDENTTAVSITVTCDGAIVNGPFDVSGSGTAGVAGPPVTFTVLGFEGDPVCTATESDVPAGYTSDESFCAQVLLSVRRCTITNTLLPTPTPTPTATPTPTPTATIAGSVVGPVTGIGGSTGGSGANGGLWAVIIALFAAVAAGVIIFGWRNISLARPADVPGMMPAGQLLRVQVQPIEGFPAYIDALQALSRMPGIAQAHAVRLWQGDGIFAVTLSAPATLEALARKASAVLGRTVRIK